MKFKRLLAVLLAFVMTMGLVSVDALAAPAAASNATLGDTSVETPSEKIDGTVYEATLSNGATAFVYVASCEDFGIRASATPILQVYGNKPYTAETAKQTAIDSGLAAIADHEKGTVVFVNPIGKTWGEADATSYEAAKNLYADGTNNDKKASDYTIGGKNADGKYPGSYARNYVFAEGAGADFIYKYVAVGIAGGGQFFGDATYKPTAALLMNPTSTEEVDLKQVDDRQVPVVLVNGTKEMIEAFSVLNDTEKIKTITSSTKNGFEKSLLLAAYNDVIEHYLIREMACPTSLLYQPSCAALNLKEAKIDYKYKDGTVLTYYKWEPSSGTKGLPVVVTMHGSGNSAEMQAITTGLITLAGQEKFVLLSLENYSNENLSDEKLMQAIKAAVAEADADESRVYTTGFSMGSMRTWSLSSSYSDYFAGAIGMNGFNGGMNADGFDNVMPFYAIGGRESFITAFEFPSADSTTQLEALMDANHIPGVLNFTDDLKWGLKPTSTRKVVCEDLHNTTLNISEFASCDGNIYTTFVDASYAGHEPLRYATADAWKFIKKFSRNADGTIAMNGKGSYDGTFAGFADVSYNAWYADAVKAITEKGIVKGTGGQKFSPTGSVTRGTAATMLARMVGEDTEPGNGQQWYEKGMAWAVANGISYGTSPTEPITRQEIVYMLWNTLKPEGTGSLSGFNDASAIDIWAKEAMEWAVGAGVIQGHANGSLGATGVLTRAQLAQIFYNYYTKAAK